jgi:hypothetical protein
MGMQPDVHDFWHIHSPPTGNRHYGEARIIQKLLDTESKIVH